MSDTDSDTDGTVGYSEECDVDPNKLFLCACGCDGTDDDIDEDQILDCRENSGDTITNSNLTLH